MPSKEDRMTDKKLTHMVMILDRSGSMMNLAGDTIGGFNGMIKDQKKVDAELGTKTKVTTILFDDKYEVLHDAIDIQDIKEMTDKEYYVRGMTALLDAMGKTINSIGGDLKKMNDSERPDKVLFFVVTDGGENGSEEFRGQQAKIKEMVNHQENKYNWVFSFLGANQDSFLIGGNLGFKTRNISNYDPNSKGAQAVFTSSSIRMCSAKRGRAMPTAAAAYSAAVDSD